MKNLIVSMVLSAMFAVSLSADYKLILTDKEGTQTSECIKSYSFSNNLESIAKQQGLTQDVYSEEEVMTNKIYKGKPVYRKVVNLKGIHVNDAQYHTIAYTNDQNIEIMDINVLKRYYTDASFYVEPRRQATVIFAEEGYKYKMGQDNSVTEYDFDIVLEYTKTTDDANLQQEKFASYLHYIPSASVTKEVITQDMKNIGVQFLEGYTYDSATNSCNPNQ
jgi:hypothetical protein